MTGLLKKTLKKLVPERLRPPSPKVVLVVRNHGQPCALATSLTRLYPRLVALPCVASNRPEVIRRETSLGGNQGATQSLGASEAFARLLTLQRALRLQLNDRIGLMVLVEEDQLPLGDPRPKIRLGGLLLFVLPWLNSVRLLPSGVLLTTRASSARILKRLQSASPPFGDQSLRQVLAPQMALIGTPVSRPTSPSAPKTDC